MNLIRAGAAVFVSLFTCRLPKKKFLHRSRSPQINDQPKFILEMFKVRYKSDKETLPPLRAIYTVVCSAERSYYVRAASEKSKPTWKIGALQYIRSFSFNWLLVCTQNYLRTCSLNRWLWRFFCTMEPKRQQLLSRACEKQLYFTLSRKELSIQMPHIAEIHATNFKLEKKMPTFLSLSLCAKNHIV